MSAGEIKTGTIATVKVGRNEIQVEVITIVEKSWRVKSQSSGKEFEVKKLERIVREPEISATPATATIKKKSLIDAAHEILEIFGKPLNCKEMVTKSIEVGLWQPTNCKTPEQTLYGSIFREIKEKESPRFRKSTPRKGTFEAIK